MGLRFEDWPVRLQAEIRAARERPFEWGQHDCVLFASSCVLAQTGEDPAADWRGRYSDREGAEAFLRDHAGGGILESVSQALGAPLDSPLMAQRGDVALVQVMTPTEGPDVSLGVVDFDGMHVLVPAMPVGLSKVRLRRAVAAWRVG